MKIWIKLLKEFLKLVNGYYNGKYAVFFNPKDIPIYYTECEPFIGELPSFIKDNK